MALYELYHLLTHQHCLLLGRLVMLLKPIFLQTVKGVAFVQLSALAWYSQRHRSWMSMLIVLCSGTENAPFSQLFYLKPTDILYKDISWKRHVSAGPGTGSCTVRLLYIYNSKWEHPEPFGASRKQRVSLCPAEHGQRDLAAAGIHLSSSYLIHWSGRVTPGLRSSYDLRQTDLLGNHFP